MNGKVKKIVKKEKNVGFTGWKSKNVWENGGRTEERTVVGEEDTDVICTGVRAEDWSGEDSDAGDEGVRVGEVRRGLGHGEGGRGLLCDHPGAAVEEGGRAGRATPAKGVYSLHTRT